MTDAKLDAVRPPLPPPAYFFILLVAGGAAQYVRPFDIVRSGTLALVWAGFALTTIAALLMLFALIALIRHKTSPDLYKPTTAIVRSGPYRFTRNPLYLALVTLFLGIALLANSWWILGLAPVLFALLHFVVVKREEAYLEQKFGEEYLRYKRAVRRWL
jgi:Putative protein-S-isoprenylcysteine methyltransferase